MLLCYAWTPLPQVHMTQIDMEKLVHLLLTSLSSCVGHVLSEPKL